MTLPEAFYIEYILVTGKANDAHARAINVSMPIETEDCTYFNNFFWSDVKVYASNSPDVTDCCDNTSLCGVVGADSYSDTLAATAN